MPLVALLSAALAAVGVMADRALVREAAASAALATARAENDMRTAALPVRGALGQIEQAVLAGAAPAGVSRQALAVAPPAGFGSGRPYRGRPASDLLALLTSNESTAWGLPEAVVAAVALNAPGSQRAVAERLPDENGKQVLRICHVSSAGEEALDLSKVQPAADPR